MHTLKAHIHPEKEVTTVILRNEEFAFEIATSRFLAGSE
jgi:hypothetical protein